jgi:hypothetical protein
MSVKDKTLLVCDCNRTMPLDAAALARALDLPAPLRVHSMMCQRELAQFSDGRPRRRRDRVHAGAAAARGGRGRGRPRAGNSVREHPRDGRLVGRRAGRDTQDRRAARDGFAAGSRAGAERELCVEGTAPHHRPRGGRAVMGRGAARAHVGDRPCHGPHDRCRVADRARLPRLLREGNVARRMARRVRSRMGAGEPDRPRSLHALQRVPACLPGGRDRRELPGRPRSLQGPPRLRRGVRAVGAVDFARKDTRAPSRSISCSTCTRARG